jgi:hypothetical protein
LLAAATGTQAASNVVLYAAADEAADTNRFFAETPGVDSTVYALAASTKAVYAGGGFTSSTATPAATVSRVAYLLGGAWSPIGCGAVASGEGLVDNSVTAMAYRTGTVYVGGAFSAACDGSTGTESVSLAFIVNA